MGKTIRAVVLKADNNEFLVDEQFNSEYEGLTSLVGGYIEAFPLGSVTPGRNIYLWLNEEGKLKNLKPNLVLATSDSGRVLDIVVGDVVITAASQSGNTVGLNNKELKFVQSIFTNEISLPLKLGGFVTKALYLPERG